MTEFLELKPPLAALERLLEHIPDAQMPVETIRTADSLGRITAERILSPEALPAFDRSTVDGFAVRAADTFGASESLPSFLTVVGEVPMGAEPDFRLEAGQAGLIFTGGMLPQGANGVVMVEQTQETRPGEIEVLRAIGVGENILKTGEDTQVGQEVMAAGVRLRPADVGGLLALGIETVRVYRLVRIAVLSSGDEVIPPEEKPKAGQVRDINSYTLSALAAQHGYEAVRYGVVPDRAEELEALLRKALDECDAALITAGSSASTRDLTAQVIARMGEPGLLVHGVSVRPGKPTILAVCNGKPVIGLPGNPVSALVIARLFAIPALAKLAGETHPRPTARVRGRLTVNMPSQAGREDYLPVKLVEGEGGYDVEPVFFKSNLIFTLAKADGLLFIPADVTGFAAGDAVDVLLL